MSDIYPGHPTTGTFLSWTPDPLSVILETNYNRYTSKVGIDGVGSIDENTNTFSILAAMTDTPGQGQFREFIRICKENFDCLIVEAIMEPALLPILERYGFKPTIVTAPWGEKNPAMQWDKEPSTTPCLST